MQAREAIAKLDRKVVPLQPRLVQLAGARDGREDVAHRRDGTAACGQPNERHGHDHVVPVQSHGHAGRPLRESERRLGEVRPRDARKKMLENLVKRFERTPLFEERDRRLEKLEVESRPM
jgi:hypothetical protein